MSKATIKKLLQSMPKEEIIGMVLEMYDGDRLPHPEGKGHQSAQHISHRSEEWEQLYSFLAA